MMSRIQQTHDLPGKTVEHGYPAIQEVAVEVERHLVWSHYEIFDREKSRDWFHPPFIGQGMVCSGYKGLNCTVLASCLNSGPIQDMSLDLVNFAKTLKVTWCVFFGGGGAFYTLFHNITYLSIPIVGSCWSSQWVVLAARPSFSWWRWWLDTLWSTAEGMTALFVLLPWNWFFGVSSAIS